METVSEMNKLGCKELLVWRMFIAIGLSILLQFFLMSIVVLSTNLNFVNPLLWIQNTWNVIFSFKMWCYFLLLASVTFLQGFMCSKDYLSPPKYLSNRFFIFCSMLGPRNILLSGLYIAVGGILTWLQLSLKGGLYSSLTKPCITREGICLIEEYLFLMLGGLWNGLYFFMKFNFFGVQCLRFPIIPQTKFSQVKRAIHELLPQAMTSAIWPTIYFAEFYFLFGSYTRNGIISLLAILIEDQPLDKLSRLLNLSLLFHLWLYGTLFVVMANTMHLMFQACLTEWIPFNIEHSLVSINNKPKIILAEILSMEEIPIIRQLGFLDLMTLAQKDKSRRAILFTLSQPGGHPYNWNRIMENSLLAIKEFTLEINSICSTKEEKTIIIEAALMNSSVYHFQKHHQYHMRNLVSPQTPSQTEVLQAPKDDVPSEQFFIRHLKNIKQNVLTYLFSKPLICFIFGEQMDSKARHVLMKGQPIVWAVEATSSLAVASLTEDRYGIAQKDLPAIVDSLLGLKQALDKLHKTSIMMRKPVNSDKVLKQCLTSLRSATKRSIYRIVNAFEDFIEDIGLTSENLEQLQPFFNYRE